METYTSQGTNIVRMLSGQSRRIDDDDEVLKVEDIDEEFEVEF